MLSGLEVNFGKCRVVGLNLREEEVSARAALLGCQVGSLPITYLGVKVGGQARRTENWGDVVDKIKKRLLSWGARKVSLGGRITLTNAVLAAIPIYRMSFSRIPVTTAKEITSLQRNFLWGGEGGSGRKTAWVKWEHLCLPKKAGGLGFKEMRWFNDALLGKWIWRFLKEKNSLWAKVVRSRHGGIRLQQSVEWDDARRGRKRGWWSRIIELGKGEEGKWFWSNLKRSIGNGLDTRFWEDQWLDSGILKDRFPRLYHLSADKGALVGQAGRWEEGRWRWEISWRRRLLDRESDMENALMLILESSQLVSDREDDWKWEGAPNGAYSVKRAYEAIAEMRLEASVRQWPRGVFRLVWKVFAPFKEKAMAWRLLWDRLPTRDNLIKRRIISAEEGGCSGCNEVEESAAHVFLRCAGVVQVWNNVLRWMGVSWVAPRNIIDHLNSFARLLGGGKKARICGGLWICCISAIWRRRNSVIFQN